MVSAAVGSAGSADSRHRAAWLRYEHVVTTPPQRHTQVSAVDHRPGTGGRREADAQAARRAAAWMVRPASLTGRRNRSVTGAGRTSPAAAGSSTAADAAFVMPCSVPPIQLRTNKPPGRHAIGSRPAALFHCPEWALDHGKLRCKRLGTPEIRDRFYGIRGNSR
ncbi:hypothetical protein Atai01_63890 [Amycolatopsis taiwanensis]|uniref:Uncharacterized protein n=1 Tax=Amycolatopsis taiwanensis TaxID=342230 RepID=A0A9W6VIJ9_9PSEU|nr:hypothetical protein Atai01_63890 [Amycolatopsis taiwanensis]